MKRSNHNKTSSFSYSNLHFYEPKTSNHTSQYLYESTRGHKEEDTFRRKKVSACHELNYSSCLNPFARTRNAHYDLAVKEADRKRKVPFASNQPTDPVTMKFQMPEKEIRIKP